MTDEHTHTLPADGDLVPVVSFLSGSRRGTTLRLGGERLCIGTDPACEIRVPMDTEPLPRPHHATLERRGDTYELIPSPGAEVWVNGEPADHMVLASGDVMEIGRDGALLRYRIYEAGSTPYKSLPEVFADCYECARSEPGVLRKAGTLAKTVPAELATNTTRRFRLLMVIGLATLAGATVITSRRNARLEEQLLGEIQRVEGLTALVRQARQSEMTTEELGEVVAQLQSTAARVDSLEARSNATARVIAEAAGATLFLQGSYRFVEPESGRPLRMVLGPTGRPLTNPLGHPALSLDGDGPPLEIFVTGTGFVATPEGLALTNRHVAAPWEFDDAAQGILESGFTAEWARFVGYLPDRPEALEMELVIASDDADLAVVQSYSVSGRIPHMELAEVAPSPGDPVIVMGYPLGLRALLARSEADFVSGLQAEGVTDFFDQASRIARAGYMQPLATRGIVGQVTAASVVYDAETTSGGSGGPVLTLEGTVAAVNVAILPEFGGSNLGVPAQAARALIERARGN